MTASTVEVSVRQAIATALASVSANVYSYVPETPITPAVCLVPDSPYFEITTIGKSTIDFKVNLVITAMVSYSSNPAALDNLEKLIVSILAAIPAGYELSTVERPSVTQVGASNLLVADIRVSTYYTQTN